MKRLLMGLAVLLKTDGLGAVQWQQHYDQPLYNEGHDVI